ncbi:MAG TPA: hypothetical protein VGN34_33080 [Ktedonobacteraceae bacterium]
MQFVEEGELYSPSLQIRVLISSLEISFFAKKMGQQPFRSEPAVFAAFAEKLLQVPGDKIGA